MALPSRFAIHLSQFPLLQEGSTNRDGVEMWQTFLVTQGYDIVVDGLFGPNTKTATIAYQIRVGHPPTGIVNRDTWYKKAKATHSAWASGAGGGGADVVVVDPEIPEDEEDFEIPRPRLSTEAKIGIGIGTVFGLGVLWAVVRR